MRIAIPESLRRYIVEKGSITVDGVSLTVSAIGADWFEISLIPTTLAPHEPGSGKVRQSGEPGGRRDREVCRAIDEHGRAGRNE